jgi:hypothetical protein
LFRTNFLRPKTIGIIPAQGYRPEEKQSVKALQWIKYVAQLKGVHIQHARNGGETDSISKVPAESQKYLSYVRCTTQERFLYHLISFHLGYRTWYLEDDLTWKFGYFSYHKDVESTPSATL